jgi:signal transduction histidine kinase
MDTTHTNKTLLLRFGGPAAAVVMLTLGSFDLIQRYAIAWPTGLALCAGLAVPFLLHRRPHLAWWLALSWSLVTTGVMFFTSVYVPMEPWPWPVNSMAVLALTTGILAAQGRRAHTVGAVALITVIGAWAAFAMPLPQDWISVIACTVVCTFAAVLGDVVHSRSRVVDHLAVERQVSSAERARRSLVEERARIARELHDVVAHHMSMITVQAETARYRLAGLPEPVVTEFTGIAALARSSLTELRGLLTALRDEQDAPGLAPQPTLADLGELTARITAAGTPVRLTVAGAVAGLPEVLQLSAYRIVQEALSNVVRHAGGAPTTVDVAAADALRIEVSNARPATPATPASRGDEGHGLVGLRERATLLGGTFEVDQPGGGWRIRATLPIPASQGEAS